MEKEDLLKEIQKLQSLAETRARQLLHVRGLTNKVFVHRFIFGEDYICVEFQHNRDKEFPSPHPCHSINMSLEDLLMNDSDWNKYIERKINWHLYINNPTER